MANPAHDNALATLQSAFAKAPREEIDRIAQAMLTLVGVPMTLEMVNSVLPKNVSEGATRPSEGKPTFRQNLDRAIEESMGGPEVMHGVYEKGSKAPDPTLPDKAELKERADAAITFRAKAEGGGPEMEAVQYPDGKEPKDEAKR